MTVLYLTNNTQLAGTARILLSWLVLGRDRGLRACVAAQGSGELVDRLARDGVPWVVSPMPWPGRARPWSALREAWRVSRFARAQGASLVHCNEHDVYPFGVLVARLMRVPIVCHVRFKLEPGFGRWAFGGWRRPAALLWTTQQQRRDSLDAVDGIVPADRQHLIRLGPDPAIFHPDGPARETARERFGIRAGEVAIGTAAALRPIKRIHDFIDVVMALSSRHAGVVGLIAGGAVPGEEAYRQDVERRIRDSGLGRRLRWLGHLEPIDGFLRSLDVFVSTSEYETFGNSVAEAMACGVPVAGYVGGSVHEVIGDAGAVIPNGDVDALIQAADTLLAGEDARHEAGERGRRRAHGELNPAASFEKLRAVYEGVIGVSAQRRSA